MKQQWLNLIGCFLIICIAISSNLNAQSKSINDIRKVKLRNMGPIIKDEVVEGYYMFYLYDKASRGERIYKLNILDANLEKIATKTIKGSNYLILQDASYNNEDIMMKFVDLKSKIVSFKRYSGQGDYKGQKTYTIANKKELYFVNQGEDNVSGLSVYPVDRKGFVDFQLTIDKRQGYAVRFYPSGEDGKGWTYKSSATSKEHEVAAFVASNEKMVVSTIWKRKSALSKDVEHYILGLDVDSGKKLFEKPIEDSKYAVQLISGFKNESTGNIELTGYYYDKDDKTFKSASRGMFFFVLDENGEPTSRKYVSWKDDVSKLLPSNDRGKLKEVGYMFFHKFLRTSEGKIFAIGEQYSKVADGVGIAMMALSGGDSGASVAKLKIENFYLFEFDPEFNLVDVEIIEKEKSSTSFPNAGYSFLSPQIMAQLAKQWGGFDYLFTQNFKDRSMFTLGYLDYQRNKKGPNSVVFGAATHDGTEYTMDKINIDTKKGKEFRVMEAKLGHILIMEYLPKEKTLELNLEKINY